MIDIQRRTTKVGRIRTGISVLASNGRQRPEKLTRFLLTTESRVVADGIAGVYGGKVDPFTPMGGTQKGWQVLVDVDELPVAVPPGEQVVSQWWEMWSGGGCLRRCDGATASVFGEAGEERVPCRCPGDPLLRADAAKGGGACRPTTRLSLILPDVPGTGTFLLESHGAYAAQELGGTAELLEKARAHGLVLPAVLRLEQREGVRRPGVKTNKFAVPVLQLLHSLRELEEIAAGGGAGRVMLPPPPVRAITAAPSAPPAPAVSMPESAQGAADLLPTITDLDGLLALGKHAAARGWLEEMVTDVEGVMEPLGPLARARRAEIERETAGAP